jgi:hypothetical protein
MMKQDGTIQELKLLGGPLHRLGCQLALAACVGVLLLGTLQGILAAIAISVLTLFY